MAAVKYIVDLTMEERDSLQRLIRRAKPAARQTIRARVLLKADQGLTDEEIATALEVGTATVGRIRQRFVEEGLARALKERPRPGQRPKLSGKQEAPLVAVACRHRPCGPGPVDAALAGG